MLLIMHVVKSKKNTELLLQLGLFSLYSLYLDNPGNVYSLLAFQQDTRLLAMPITLKFAA